MLRYIFKRLLLIIPTLFLIVLVNFALVQLAPGGPVEYIVNAATGMGHGGEVSSGKANISSMYKATKGMEAELVEQLNKYYGFDQPAYIRFFKMIKQYLVFDLGESYYQSKKVSDLIIDRIPISLSLGVWSTLLIYLIAIPLGIKKAKDNGSVFDHSTSFIISLAYSLPTFVLGILLIVFFAGNNLFYIFPISGITSSNFEEMSTWGKIKDYIWHIALPTITITLGGLASLTFLTKNCFMDEMHKQYVNTARAKGLSENSVMYKHVFRNAMLIVLGSMPETLLRVFFTGALLTEIIFSLHGIGYLSYESIINRDYAVVFGTLYIFTLIGLFCNLLTDITYMLIDPRIDYEGRA